VAAVLPHQPHAPAEPAVVVDDLATLLGTMLVALAEAGKAIVVRVDQEAAAITLRVGALVITKGSNREEGLHESLLNRLIILLRHSWALTLALPARSNISIHSSKNKKAQGYSSGLFCVF
jgi:hypothetical protein